MATTPSEDPVLEDGCEGITEEDEDRFEEWLLANGGKHPKILWPARDTIGGVRGTTALEDIESGEYMLEIPTKLMISPPMCRECPELKDVFEENPMVFAGDNDKVLCLFLMHAKLEGEANFWAPYIKMLPRPGSIADWTTEELEELQNNQLVTEALQRAPRHEASYNRMFSILTAKYPERFPSERYSLDLYVWAHMTVAARAFGRRLPWTALVPFADCLNHSNVQTKYDYNVESNGVFRLFPTGVNRYPVGTEVFNSYGRRDNRHLCLEYGFAIENNEWASFHCLVALPPSDPLYEDKRKLMTQFHLPSRKTYRLQWNRFNDDVIIFFRIVCLDATELADGPSLIRIFSKPLSMRNELAALRALADHYRSTLTAMPTTLDQDLELQATKVSPRLSVALAYRLTRKRILLQQLRWVDAMIPLMEAAAAASTTGGGNYFNYSDPVLRYVKNTMEYARTPPMISMPSSFPRLTISKSVQSPAGGTGAGVGAGTGGPPDTDTSEKPV